MSPTDPATPDGPTDTSAPPSRFLVLTGDGKGKTTSAIGMAVRALGHGRSVAVLQFIKSTGAPYGEQSLPSWLPQAGLPNGGRLDWQILGDGCLRGDRDEQAAAQLNLAGWQQARELLAAGGHDLVILDELPFLITFGWLPVSEAIEGLTARHPRTSIVITGRGVPAEIRALADTVTELREEKHIYRTGVTAQQGIEF